MTARAKVRARELVSPRAFAAALGVSRQAVMKGIRSGRLLESLSKDERTGHHRIDVARGRHEWESWADPSMRSKREEQKAGGRPSEAEKATASLFDQQQVREHRTEQLSHARASAERISLDAELKRIELEQARGNLVDKGATQREAFRLGRLLRERLQAIPDRVSASLAALDKPAQVHQVLAAEIARALEVESREEEPVPT